MRYILYYDSGTSNTRAYLLGEDLAVVRTEKKAVGSRDSAIAGSSAVLIAGMKELYDRILGSAGITGEDIRAIYASGMVTSPYGLKEVPHSIAPLSVRSFARDLVLFREDTLFHRDIWLIPGLKTVSESFAFVGNMRGEEIEILGTLDELERRGLRRAALILPGSHTHVAYVKDGIVSDILSTFTGELFYALKKETILAPILERAAAEPDERMVARGVKNLRRFGFNRALYIAHAMRIMDTGTPEERFSYSEGVVNGGVRQALEYYCENRWKDCDTAVIVSDEFMYKLFRAVFDGSEIIRRVVWLPCPDGGFAVRGLKKLLAEKGE